MYNKINFNKRFLILILFYLLTFYCNTNIVMWDPIENENNNQSLVI